jgi:mRNA interferase HicA
VGGGCFDFPEKHGAADGRGFTRIRKKRGRIYERLCVFGAGVAVAAGGFGVGGGAGAAEIKYAPGDSSGRQRTQGCTFEDGTKHTKVLPGKRFTWMLRHPSQEIKTGTLKAILKDLDLRKE